MIPLTNHDFQWGGSEVVIIHPDIIDDFPIQSFIRLVTSGMFQPRLVKTEVKK